MPGVITTANVPKSKQGDRKKKRMRKQIHNPKTKRSNYAS